MVSDKMAEALNKQINAEMYSSYLYLSMAAFFEAQNFNGFAHWMEAQSAEEYGHALKIYKYLNDVGSKVDLLAIEKPKAEWKDNLEVFTDALEHEKKVTKMINELTDQAVSEKDHSTNIFLQWFVQEQVEEVASTEEIVDQLKLIGDNKSALFMLDKELGQRRDTE